VLTLKSLTRLPTPAYHCAFTSLCQYQGSTYIAYRQAVSHNVQPGGHVVIQRSADLDTWEEVATLRTGGDDRDPHLLATADRLFCTWGTYVPLYDAWTGRLSTQVQDIWSYGAASYDGTAWGPAYRIGRPGSWLWHVLAEPRRPAEPGLLTRAMGRTQEARPPAETWYGVSYDVGDGVADRCHTLTLWRGGSPLTWERWATMLDARLQLSDVQPSEPVLFWKDSDTLGCIARTEKCAIYGESPRPFSLWAWRQLKVAIHAPAIIAVPDIGWIVAGRDYVPGRKPTDKPKRCCTSLWYFDPSALDAIPDAPALTPALTLPSSGDCSYPGLAWDAARGELLCSYYSQHEHDDRQIGLPHVAEVYLARLTVES